MIRRKEVHNPFNFSFFIMYNEFPKGLHENLNVPGIFRRKSNVKVQLNDGTILEMDASYTIDPDFKIVFEPMIVNLEHQSTPVNKDKIKTISSYSLQQIHDEKLPPLSVIVSHIDEKEHVQTFQRTPSFITKLYFITLDEKDIEKRLNNLTNKINQQIELTDNDALDLGIIALFAPRHKAKKITEKVIKLFNKISNKLSKKMQLTIYTVLYVLTDAYCDEENEFRRMINMLNKNISEETRNEFESFNIIKNRNFELENKIQDMTAEQNNANTKIQELENKIKILESQLKNAK